MGGDGHHVQPVDLVELLLLGHGRAGHARELLVDAEVVLEGDRGHGHRLALDAHALLGLDGLVEALRPAAAGHLATRELVDDDDLAVLDDVVAVALVEGVGSQRLLEVARQARVRLHPVQVADAEQLLDLGDALLRGRDGVLLEVDEVVAALLRVVRTGLEPRHQPSEGVVQVLGFPGRAADDERRARLVDEDVVDLVHDAEEALALDPLGKVLDHVVAQVVEAQLVVGGVGDVRRVGLHPRHRPQVHELLVLGPVVRVEEEGRVVLDDADRETQAVVDGPHPLRVALGQVVVDGDDVHAAPGHGVQGRGQGRHEGLALARLHLRDLALVEHDAAHELDVEVAHAKLPAADLAGRREDVRQDVVEGPLDLLAVFPLALTAQLGASLAVGGLTLLLRWLGGRRSLAHLFARIGHLGLDLLVREGLVVGLELIDARHDGTQSAEVGVVAAADEAAEDAAHGRQKYRVLSAAVRVTACRRPRAPGS